MLRRSRSSQPLRDVSIFAGITGSELDRVRSLLTPITVDGGTVLMRQGTAGDEFLIVADGLISVSRTVGNALQVLAMVSSGAVLGEMALLNQARRCATATTIQRSTVYVGTPREFFELLQAVPSVKQSIIEASRIRVRDNDLAA